MAAGAEVLVGVRGDDLREDVVKFIMCQMTGETASTRAPATSPHAFDADVVVDFSAGQTSNHGRAAEVAADQWVIQTSWPMTVVGRIS